MAIDECAARLPADIRESGFPEMGIKGAAIASVIAEGVSIVFFLVYTRLTVDIKKYALNQFRSFVSGC